jgi:hypothetical protein
MEEFPQEQVVEGGRGSFIANKTKRTVLFVYFPLFALVVMGVSVFLDEKSVRGLDLIFAVGGNIAAFAWIRADSEDRGYKLHRLFPFAVVIFGTLALIYYLFRSRDFVAAMSSIGWLLLYCICLFLALMIVLAILMTIAFITGIVPMDPPAVTGG